MISSCPSQHTREGGNTACAAISTVFVEYMVRNPVDVPHTTGEALSGLIDDGINLYRELDFEGLVTVPEDGYLNSGMLCCIY